MLFAKGDRVKVVSECSSQNEKGVVSRADRWDVTVHFSQFPLGAQYRTYSPESLTKLDDDKNQSSPQQKRLAVFFVEPKEYFEINDLEMCDFCMIEADSLDHALERISVVRDTEGFESVLFDGKMYNIKAYTGFLLDEDETR